VKADNDADADYDRAARELAFEAKGQVGAGWLLQGEQSPRIAQGKHAVCLSDLHQMLS
jgi:hypothetical protein